MSPGRHSLAHMMQARTSVYWPCWINRHRRAAPGGAGRCWPRRLGDVPADQVWRILRRLSISLQQTEIWCLSTDPDFTTKAMDIASGSGWRSTRLGSQGSSVAESANRLRMPPEAILSHLGVPQGSQGS